MKLVLLALVGLAAASLPEFRAWQAQHGRAYATAVEESRRYNVYLANKERVAALNAEAHATFALNQFADLSPEEFKAQYLGTRRPQRPAAAPYTRSVRADPLPDDFNWATQGYVTPVKNQGSCGSCWAFSTVGCMEGAHYKATKTLVSLSEQQLVDCDHNCQDPTNKDTCDQGCNGGYMENAMQYGITSGMESEKDYGYKGSDGKCSYDLSKVVAKFTNWTQISEVTKGPHPTEKEIQQFLFDDGPFAIAVHADPWQFYFGGIYDSASCKGGEANLDHGVLLTGWGHDASSKKDYWIIKNSWGGSWGKSGYIWISRDKDMCGVADDVSLIIA